MEIKSNFFFPLGLVLLLEFLKNACGSHTEVGLHWCSFVLCIMFCVDLVLLKGIVFRAALFNKQIMQFTRAIKNFLVATFKKSKAKQNKITQSK